MLLPTNFETLPNSYAFAVALYLDAYTDATSTTLYLPKRTRMAVIDPKRIPHLDWWTDGLHTQYRQLPSTMKLEQFVVLDDGWAAATLKLLQTNCRANINAAARIAFYMWKSVLFWGSYGSRRYATGFVATSEFIAEACRCSPQFAAKVVGLMIEAGLIHRKWVGYAGHGSCYLAGKANHVADLIAQNAEIDQQGNLD